MNRATRTMLALAILSGGVCAAMLFRHKTPPADPPTPGTSERLVLRRQLGPPPEPAPRPMPSPAQTIPTAAPRRAEPAPTPAPRYQKPAILTPMDRGQPPPDLARSYPRSQDAPDSRWGTSLGMEPPSAAYGNRLRLHRIVDGDTLQSLAEQYLGGADRAEEIYEANRDLLDQPDLLPIGEDLKIPPSGVATAPVAANPLRPLAPIPPAQ